MAPLDIVTEVTDSGLRGRGGAGFPTGIKWKTVHDAKADQKYICCNADEGDSGTFADRMLMEGDPFCLIEGMTIAGIAVGATKGYIYVRSEYPHAIDTLREAIRIAAEADWLGRTSRARPHDFELYVRMGAGAYICGEETSMLESLEGKPRPGPLQAAAARARGAVRQADRHQQRAEPRLGADHPRQGRRVLSRLRHRPVARHARLPARRQHQAGRPRREGFRHHRCAS